jgi:hypothetical protein
LIQIAAPDTSSNAAKEEIVMSAVITSKIATNNVIECVLSASDSYIETLSIQAIDAQPGMLELVIRTQLLSAKNPAEKRVKSRTCIERSRLIELQEGVGQFLQATGGSSGELLEGYRELSGKSGIEVKIIDTNNPLPVVSSVTPAIKEAMQ